MASSDEPEVVTDQLIKDIGATPLQGAAAAAVSFGYSAAEDRIIGVFAQGETGATVQLTRRVVRQLVAALAQLLDRASPVASRAPASMRAEVVQLEHQSAVAQLTTGGSSSAARTLSMAARNAPALLITRVNLTQQPSGYLLVVSDAAGRNVTTRLQWQDLHRLLGALHQQADSAKWDLDAAVPWLAAEGSPDATA